MVESAETHKYVGGSPDAGFGASLDHYAGYGPKRNKSAFSQLKDMMNPSHPSHDFHTTPGHRMSTSPFNTQQSLTFDSDKLEVWFYSFFTYVKKIVW